MNEARICSLFMMNLLHLIDHPTKTSICTDEMNQERNYCLDIGCHQHILFRFRENLYLAITQLRKRNQRSYDKLTLRTAATEAALLLMEKALTPADIAAKVSANAENFIVLGSIID